MPLPVLALLATLLAVPAELSWQAIEECPGVGELETTIEGWIGKGTPGGEGVRARGRIQSTAGGYTLDLVIELGPREQAHALQGHDCAELTDLAALLIASAIDPFVLGSASGATIDVFERLDPLDPILVEPLSPWVEPAPAPLIPPAIPERSIPEPEPDDVEPLVFGPITALDEREPPRARRVEGFLAASGMGFAGLFQRPSGGVELLGGIDRGALRVAIGAVGWFGGSFRSSDGTVGGDLRAGTGVIEICGVPTLERGRVGFPLCATGTAGAIVGSGVGVPDSATVVRPWAAAGGDVGLRWRVHRRVALRLGVGVLAALIRPVWEVAGPIVSFTTPPVMGRVRVAVELFFGRR
jgi:hypothetical protein